MAQLLRSCGPLRAGGIRKYCSDPENLLYMCPPGTIYRGNNISLLLFYKSMKIFYY